MRQKVLEGRGVENIIWGMITESIEDAVDKYVTKDFVAANVSEWAHKNFRDRHRMRAIYTAATIWSSSRNTSRSWLATRSPMTSRPTLRSFLAKIPPTTAPGT